ncbi:MAG: hypothetical protein ACR2NA_10065, partial [Solirubrobacterales bacterium]
AAPAGRGPLARRLLVGTLDRSVDVAATLELRGYGLERPRARRRRSEPFSPADRRCAFAAGLVAVAAVIAVAAGGASFDPYPLLRVEWSSGYSLAVAVLVAAVLAPFAARPARRPRPSPEPAG